MAQLVSASGLGPEGPVFESQYPDRFPKQLLEIQVVAFSLYAFLICFKFRLNGKNSGHFNSRLICIKSSKIFNIEDMPPEFAFKSLNLDYIEDLT